MSYRTLLLALLAPSLAAAQETARQYLSGKGNDDAVRWEFFCTAGARSGEWTTIPVPSCWDAIGFGSLNYRADTPPFEQGKYRRTFNVTPEWRGQRVFIIFDGVLTDAEVSVNGKNAGPKHQGGFYRFSYDITALLKFGDDNLLEVSVDKHSADESINRAERNADYWVFGGIFRPVWIEAKPPRHIERVAIDAKADGTISVDVFAGGEGAADRVEAQVIDAVGNAVGKPFSAAFTPSPRYSGERAGERGKRRLTTGSADSSNDADSQRPRSPETADRPPLSPALPPTAARLPPEYKEEGGRLPASTRSAATDAFVTRVTGKIDAPKPWTAETPNLYLLQLRLMHGEKVVHRTTQRFGFRTIEVRPGDGIYVNGKRILLKGTNRHSFWPESGRTTSKKISRDDVMLMKEMNCNAVRASHYPPDEHFLDACDELGLYVLDELAGWQKPYDEPNARRLVGEMIRRDVNHPSILFWDNGNEGGWNTAVDDEFAKWDPQGRTVLHPWELHGNVNTKHYRPYDDYLKLLAGPDIFLPTEFLHGLFDGGSGAGLADHWDAMRASKVGGGGFLWAYVDETVKRPDTGKMDTSGNQAPDGVVGPYRQKEGSFYAAKEVWSPIVVKRTVNGFDIENRYDFTNAKDCTFTWQLRVLGEAWDESAGHEVLEEWKSSIDIPPGEGRPMNIEMPRKARRANALSLRVDDRDGRELWTWVWPLREWIADTILFSGPPAIIEDQDPSITARTRGVVFTFSKRTGQLERVRRGDVALPLKNGPRLAVGEAKLTGIECREADGDVMIEAKYDGALRTVRWLLRGGDWLELDYTYALAGDFDFFGVSFDLPESEVKSMRWLGQGPFRVWKNRLAGGTLGVWENAFNDTMTGYAGWDYPEFKGCYAGVRWMRLDTTTGPILIALDNPSLYVQVLCPKFPGHPKPLSPTTAATQRVKSPQLSGNAWANLPDAGLAILHAIPPIGSKFLPANTTGPQGQQTKAAGEYRGRVKLYFGEPAVKD